VRATDTSRVGQPAGIDSCQRFDRLACGSC